MDTEMVAQMWENYSKNSEFNLEATGQKKDPIWSTVFSSVSTPNNVL